MTNTMATAKKILSQAEIELRALIEACAKTGDYATIAELAALATSVGHLVGRDDRAAEAKGPSTTRTARPISRKKEYPRFVRSGERLVKIGWSKKRGAAYEHKVPREMVVRVARAISDTARPGKAFTVESLPLSSVGAANDEPPVYQAYVVIAWLRSLGALKKQGRDGYVAGKGVPDAVERGWIGLEEKA
jgi:hypothetical protein